MSAALRPARIGPNAITQVTGALERELGRRAARDFLRAAGFGGFVDAPPQDMVDELAVIALHSSVRAELSEQAFHSVERAAGEGTGDYLLAHRIPWVARTALRAMPKSLASRLLLAAISRHAWTFAGSGRCTTDAGPPVSIIIEQCALCCGAHAARPQCDYYAATFARLFRALVDSRARVVETECIASGGRVCRFVIDWSETVVSGRS